MPRNYEVDNLHIRDGSLSEITHSLQSPVRPRRKRGKAGKVSLLIAKNKRMARLITNAKLVADLEKITCPVCFEKIAADRSYADPYRHLLKHLLPGEDAAERMLAKETK